MPFREQNEHTQIRSKQNFLTNSTADRARKIHMRNDHCIHVKPSVKLLVKHLHKSRLTILCE